RASMSPTRRARRSIWSSGPTASFFWRSDDRSRGPGMITETFNDRLFDGKTALVTGAGRGIGAGIARCFAALGATVLLQDIDAEGRGCMSRELAGARGGVAVLEGDLAVPGGADAAFDGALRASPRIDFLVNNAGRSAGLSTLEITEENTQALIELNLKSVV